MKERFEFFWGGPFSQWYKHDIDVDGVTYNTAEQYMMAMKAKHFGDEAMLKNIMSTKDPQKQKAFGRKVNNFDALEWNKVSRGYVYDANLEKFQDPALKKFLMDTETKEIVEASPYDKIWGIGLGEGHPDILDKSKWKGTNWLGEVLMKVREDLKT